MLITHMLVQNCKGDFEDVGFFEEYLEEYDMPGYVWDTEGFEDFINNSKIIFLLEEHNVRLIHYIDGDRAHFAFDCQSCANSGIGQVHLLMLDYYCKGWYNANNRV